MGKELDEPFQGNDERGEYLRITDIIKPFSGVEFVPPHFLVPAAEKGTLVHSYIESKLAGFERRCENEKISPYLKSFDHFWEQEKDSFEKGDMILEKRLFCDEHKITGKSDCMIVFPDRTLIYDWKTSARPHLAWRLQSAAYRYLAESNGYENVNDVVFLKLCKRGGLPTEYKYVDYEQDLARFFSCLELYKFFKMDTTRGWKNENE